MHKLTFIFNFLIRLFSGIHIKESISKISDFHFLHDHTKE
jgi:hypothetical protein